MNLLLDTHVFLWFLDGNDQIGDSAKEAILDTGNTVYVSMVSFYELAVKIRIGKLDNDIPSLLRGAEDAGLLLLDLDPSHCVEMSGIPQVEGHRDPFDLMLVAQAIVENMILVTNDRKILNNYTARFLPCVGISA